MLSVHVAIDSEEKARQQQKITARRDVDDDDDEEKRVKTPEDICSKVTGDAGIKKEFQRILNGRDHNDFKGAYGPYSKYNRLERQKLDAIMRGCDLSWEQVQELYTCFLEFDVFGQGVIDAFSIKHVSEFTGREISEEEGQGVIATVDESGDGVLDFFDFIRTMSGVTKEPLDEWDQIQVFKVFDSNDDSFISPLEMHHAFLTLGIDLNSNEINDIFEQFDTDSDGLISYEEFVYLIEEAHNIITYEEREKEATFKRQQKEKDEEDRVLEDETLAASVRALTEAESTRESVPLMFL